MPRKYVNFLRKTRTFSLESGRTQAKVSPSQVSHSHNFSVYILCPDMYIECYTMPSQGTSMPTAGKRTHKHFQLDARKIKRAQRALQAKTETEAIDRSLDLVIAEHERNRLTLEATELFLNSGIPIRDVYGTLDE